MLNHPNEIPPHVYVSIILRFTAYVTQWIFVVRCIIATQVYRRPWKYFLWTGLIGSYEHLSYIASSAYYDWYNATQVNPNTLEALLTLQGIDYSFYLMEVLYLLPPLALVLLALYDRKRPDAPVYEPLPLPVFFRNLVPWTKSAVRRVAAFIREHKIL